MAGKETVGKKLARVRKPRVHIMTEVERGKAIELSELPFVVGVIGDFSGQADPTVPAVPLKDRRFVDVNPDNFDEVLEKMQPRLTLDVEDRLNKSDGRPGRLKTTLGFKTLEDFEPQEVAKRVGCLSDLLDLRRRLNDLKARMDGKEKFEALLEKIFKDPGQRTQLADDIRRYKESKTK